MTLEVSQAQHERTALMFRSLARDDGLDVVFRHGAFWAFGPELSIRRLDAKYQASGNARMGWSDNLGSYYFVIDMPNWTGDLGPSFDEIKKKNSSHGKLLDEVV
jgi:hypothetical protein